MSETSEIIKEARKAGMQTAIMLFAALVLVLIAFCGLFGYYIHKSYDTVPTNYIEATQENTSGDNTITQGDK